MAYGLKKISPVDLKPSTALGVALPFSTDNVFTSVYTTKDQIKYNLVNFILTDKRERPFNPNFGAGLRKYVFEQLSTETLDTIEAAISSQIEANFPSITVKSLTIKGDTERNAINIALDYSINNTNENDNVTIKIQNS
jgi:phage baseplate assembly protein W